MLPALEHWADRHPAHADTVIGPFDVGICRPIDYTGFGSVDAYKANGAYRPVEHLLVRGGYQRLIRAPSVGKLFAPTAKGSINITVSPASSGSTP